MIRTDLECDQLFTGADRLGLRGRCVAAASGEAQRCAGRNVDDPKSPLSVGQRVDKSSESLGISYSPDTSAAGTGIPSASMTIPCTSSAALRNIGFNVSSLTPSRIDSELTRSVGL